MKDIKKCKSGDTKYINIDNDASYNYSLSKYVIVEFHSIIELDDSLKFRQIIIDLCSDINISSYEECFIWNYKTDLIDQLNRKTIPRH